MKRTVKAWVATLGGDLLPQHGALTGESRICVYTSKRAAALIWATQGKRPLSPQTPVAVRCTITYAATAARRGGRRK